MMEERPDLTYAYLVKEKKLISPGNAQFLFGYSVSDRKQSLNINNLINTAHSVCLFYAALLQAITYQDSVHKKSNKNGKICEAINSVWSPDHVSDLGWGNSLYSFLKDYAKSSNDPLFFGENISNIFSKQIELYRSYVIENGNLSSNLDYYLNFFERLITSLPLLASTEIIFNDNSQGKLRLSDGEEINAAPFFCVYDSKDYENNKVGYESRYVLTGISKGDRNYEMTLRLTRIGTYQAHTRFLTVNTNDGQTLAETIIAMCKSIGVNTTEWYTIDECWSDFAYVERIASSMTDVTIQFLKDARHYHDNEPNTYKNELKDLYAGTRFQKTIEEIQVDIRNETDLKRFWYAAIIRNGIFRTMWGLLFDEPDNQFEKNNKDRYVNGYGKAIFGLFIQYFKKDKQRTKVNSETIDAIVQRCEESIATHTEKLNEIYVDHSAFCYLSRLREIMAENRAYAVMQMVGFKESDLFPDKESLFSIYDYMDRLSNPMESVEKNLKEVLTILSEIYGALLNNQYPFDEKKFKQDVNAISQKIKAYSMKELFDYFKEEICGTLENAKESQQDCLLWKLIGKSKIAGRNTLDVLEKKIFEARNSIDSEKKIFISYAHEDIDIVREFLREALRRGYSEDQFFFDETNIDRSDSWSEVVQAEMPKCCACILFLSPTSIKKPAVGDEYIIGKKVAEKKGFEDVHKFFFYVFCMDDFNLTYNESRALATPTEKRTIEIFDDINNTTLGFFPKHFAMDSEKSIFTEISKISCSGKEKDFHDAVYEFYKLLRSNSDDPSSDDPNSDKSRLSSKCIFPIPISVRETKIKRDKMTILGYEIIKNQREKNEESTELHYILSSKRLAADDYYCIPNQNTSADDCSWIVDPILIPTSILTEANKENHDCETYQN